MYTTKTPFEKLILVCTNIRTDGAACCGNKNSIELHANLKTAVKELHRNIRVSKSGCLGNCQLGTTVVIMPDNIWFSDVKNEDIPNIIQYLNGKENFNE